MAIPEIRELLVVEIQEIREIQVVGAEEQVDSPILRFRIRLGLNLDLLEEVL
jgi:hypothetical protein